MNKMLRILFNQDSTCFACGNQNGFAVYNSDPPSLRFSRISGDVDSGGINIVEMLFRSNIFALVGGGINPKYAPNKVMVWDDFQSKCIAELEFKTNVTSVKLRKDMILITIEDKAYLYNFSNLVLISSYDIFPTKNGISAMTSRDRAVIAVPGNVLGSVIVDTLSTGSQCIITAHNNMISAIALNTDGSRLATTSERGTIIRVWDTKTREMLHEFRRGLEVVTITSLTFDYNTTRLLVCSDKGTAHIFSLIKDVDNRKSTFSYISDYLPSYFSSEWSSVSFEVSPNSVCTFDHQNVEIVYAISVDGIFNKYEYDIHSGTGKRVESHSIENL